jgi:phospholipid-binding lipoprotein MlaA
VKRACIAAPAAALMTALSVTAFAQATAPQDRAPAVRSPSDPLEPFNRAVFSFNDALDRHLLEPVARGYQKVVPELARAGVSNFFGNFADAWSAINQLLQGKGQAAGEMTIRVAANTLFGIGGLFDVAIEAGIERQSEDFGQTLGRWGLPAGPYLVWPLLGPSTLRDTVGRPLDLAWSPSAAIHDSGAGIALSTLGVIDTRANLLGASKVLDGIALDKYTFIRDAYIARRRHLVYDGNPPEPPEEKDPQPASPPPAVPK